MLPKTGQYRAVTRLIYGTRRCPLAANKDLSLTKCVLDSVLVLVLNEVSEGLHEHEEMVAGQLGVGDGRVPVYHVHPRLYYLHNTHTMDVGSGYFIFISSMYFFSFPISLEVFKITS